MNKSIHLQCLVLLILCPYNAGNTNSLFSPQNNHLYVPYITYQEQNYQAEFLLQNSNQLKLISLTPRSSEPTYGHSIVVDETLNFTVQPINLDGQLYSANISHQQGDTFNIDKIATIDQSNQKRGNILDATRVNEVSQSQLNFFVTLYNDQNANKIEFNANHDVQVYSVKYQTIDPAGDLIQASALIALPQDTDNSFPLIAYQHGTEVLKQTAPSLNPYDLPTIGLAASGYVVVSVDYLGMGDSPLLHPFLHAHSLATSVIDALRSAKQLSTERGINLNQQLFLAGYSEGGYATMAVHREIQRNYSEEFTVTASAPIAGPYALANSVIQSVSDDQIPTEAYYLPYALLAYNQIYGFMEDLNEFFQSPYEKTITQLYDGLHSELEINNALSENQQLYTPAFTKALAPQQNSWLKAAFIENDIYRWKPRAPMYLMHCINDNKVPYLNSQIAFDYFQSIDATQVQLFTIDDPELNQGDVHKNCSIPLLIEVKTIFDTLIQ